MISKLNKKAKKIEDGLRLLGFSPLKYTPASKYHDASILMTEQIQIQIGVDYTVIVREELNGGISFFETQNTIKSIIESLKKAANK